MKIASLLKRHFAAIFYLLFITAVAFITAYVFDYSLYGTVGTLFSVGFVLAIAFYWLLFCIASVNRYIFIVFTLGWFLFLKLLHSALIDKKVNHESVDSVASAIVSSVGGDYNLFNPAYLSAALSYLGIALLIGLVYFFLAKHLKAWKKLTLALAALLFLGFVFPWQETTVGKIPANYQAARQGIDYLENMNRLKKDITSDKPLNALDNIEVVVIVPDSLRAENLSLNGYAKPTSTYMEEYGFISFPKAYSCDYTDTSSVLCMFTKNAPESLDSNTPESMKNFRFSQEKSLFSLFKNAGFATFWISSYPFSVLKENNPVNALALEADNHSFAVTDGELDALQADALEKALASANPRKFIVLRAKGAMAPYYERYPADKEEFKPVCKKNPETCYNAESLVNTYDNAVKETDFFIAGLIEKLQNRPALLIVASNHGEMLGEDGLYGHGEQTANRKEVRFPALAVWVSPKLEAELKIKDTIRDNAYKAVDYSYLFTSLADCAGLKTKVAEDGKSWCRKEMKASAYAEEKVKALNYQPAEPKTEAPLPSAAEIAEPEAEDALKPGEEIPPAVEEP